ncbi:MAG: T9SS type A sorting domain-containing protein [Flavobacteriales bacterium]|nr:T9SS type A sorting domain-containing protein [Flavobacteriales bacterium]MCB9447491.1 T9SS type A sorting domain-containing protein [Flavobacteriales bacterium]
MKPYLLLLVFLGGSALAQPFPGKMGVGLGSAGGFALELPSVTPTANAWESIANGGNATTDAQGWPTEDFRLLFFDHRPFGAWNPPTDDPARFNVDVSGTYHLSFVGTATLSSWSDAPIQFLNQTHDANTNMTELDISFPPGGGSSQGTLGNYGFLMVNFSQTNSGNGPGLKNIRLTRPGIPHWSPQYFRTAFLNALSPFQCIRFMDYLKTNVSANNPTYPATTTWSQRQQMSDPRYNNAMPWEYVIALSNYFGRDIWINIPVAADDAYVTALANLMKDRLRPDVNIYIEYSNEVWNGSFPQYQYNYDAVLNAPEDADIRNSTQYDDRRRARRTAKRVIRFGEIFEQVMCDKVSARARIRPVFAWQIGGWLPWYTDVLDWINTTYGPPKNYIYGIASAPYFNDGGFGSSDTPQQIVSLMSSNSDANVDAIKTLAELADQWGLVHLQYEGGPDNGGGNTSNLANRITANRIPEVKTAVIHNYADNWFSATANGNAPVGTNDLANYFVLAGNVSRYGCWGATEDINYLSDPNNLSNAPKYDALCVLTGKCGNEPVVSLTAPATMTQVVKGQPVTISASASDPDGAVAYVEFFAGYRLLGADSTAPYSMNWVPDTTGYEVVLAKAVDNDGKYRFDDPHVLEVVESSTYVQSLDNGWGVSVYPNPADDHLTLYTQEDGVSLRIYSAVGRCVTDRMLVKGSTELSLTGMSSGLYVAVMEKNGKQVRSRFVHLAD